MSRYEIDIAAYEALRPGHLFGPRYRLISLLGQGGFGKVFQARDLSLDIMVAMKVLNPILASEASQLSRFKREVIIARKISHPNVCKIFDFGEIETLTYLTMEYVHGESLFSVLKRHESLSVGASLEICRQMCSALDAAHREGIVHRDLKPHNVMIERRGTVKIMDFGIARAADMDGITNVGTVMGSPSYMSPEQCRGEAGDPRSDLYSLGVVLYQMLTGAPPFLGNTPLGTLYLHLQKEPRPPHEIVPTLPAPIDALVLKCMAKDPAKRYASAQELGDEIVAFQREWRDDIGTVSLAELAEPPEIPQIIPITDATESLIPEDEPENPSDRSDETSLLDEEPPPTPVRARPAVLPTLHVDLPAASTAARPVSHTPRDLPAIPGEQHWTDRMKTPTFGTMDSQDGSGRSERRVRLAGMTATMLLGGAVVAAGFLAYEQGAFGPGEGVGTEATPMPTLPPEDPQKARIDEFLAQATKLETDAQSSDAQSSAASLYRRILLLDPTHEEATARLNGIVAKLRQQALTDLSSGRYQEALELAQTALVNLPEDAASKQIFKTALDQMIQVSGATSASLVRARQLIASEQPAAARALLQEILDKEPDHREAKVLMRRAEELAQRLQAEEAARKAEEEKLAQPTAVPTAELPAPTPEVPNPEPTVEASEPTPTPQVEPTAAPSGEATPSLDTSERVVRVGDLVEMGPGVTSPVLRDEVRLRLPPNFISQYRGKFIDVKLLVDDEGQVDEVEVVRTPQKSTNATVAQQLTRLRFDPARYRGVRVRCWFPMRIVVQ